MDEEDIEEVVGRSSPAWLAVSAGLSFLGLSIVSALALASHVSSTSESVTIGGVDSSAPGVPGKAAKPIRSPRPPTDESYWQGQLWHDVCEAPCAAGEGCLVSTQNTWRMCPAGELQCQKCASGMTCIPGPAEKELAPREKWRMHLSALLVRRGATQPNLCGDPHDYWVCLRKGTDASWTCLSQKDACQNSGKSARFLAIETDDLIAGGLDVEVRLHRRDGTIVASGRSIGIREGMRRRGLCSGFKLPVIKNGSHEVSFTFYLEPEAR